MSERYPARIAKAYELTVRSPGEVYEWLSKRPQDSRDAEPDWDDETEIALLSRNEPLIELGLARYSTCHSILRSIFNSRQGDGEADTAVRLTLLRHGRCSRFANNEFPQLLFEGGDRELAMASWLSVASENEISALFSNPELSNDFLLAFFAQQEVWAAIAEENRHVAIRAFADNPRCSETYPSRDFGGYDSDKYKAVFTAAWKLAETVETTLDWAVTLAVMFGRLAAGGHVEGAQSIAMRWVCHDPDEQRNAAKGGYLSFWQQIRKRLSAPDRSLTGEQRDEYLKCDDIAVRAAAYEYGEFTPDEIKGLGENEKALLVNCLLDNPHMWQNKDLRGAINALCWEVDTANEGGVWNSLTQYHCNSEEWSKNHPDWFKDENNAEYDASGKLVNPDDKPLTNRIFNEKLGELTSSVISRVDVVNQRLTRLGFIAVLLLLGVFGLAIYLVWRG